MPVVIIDGLSPMTHVVIAMQDGLGGPPTALATQFSGIRAVAFPVVAL
jgi:hypothetical protein